MGQTEQVERNQAIFRRYQGGEGIVNLMLAYRLSDSRLRKIIANVGAALGIEPRAEQLVVQDGIRPRLRMTHRE